MDLAVRTEQFCAGVLTEPGICVRHGKVAVRERERNFWKPTPAGYLVLGFLGVLLARTAENRCTGPFPMCRRCVNGRRAFLTVVAGGWIVVSLLAVISSATQSQTVTGFFAATFWVMFIVTIVLTRRRTRGVLTKDKEWLWLSHVSRAFAALVSHRV